MTRLSATALLAAVILAVSAGSARAWSAPAGTGDTVVVKMVETSATSYAFEPEEVTVRPGDRIRFVQTGVVPHNVEFRSPPAGAKLDGRKMGPFLTTKGQTYEIAIDEAFVAGEYPYICTPHEPMGMVGTITVTAPADDSAPDRSNP